MCLSATTLRIADDSGVNGDKGFVGTELTGQSGMTSGLPVILGAFIARRYITWKFTST